MRFQPVELEKLLSLIYSPVKIRSLSAVPGVPQQPCHTRHKIHGRGRRTRRTGARWRRRRPLDGVEAPRQVTSKRIAAAPDRVELERNLSYFYGSKACN